MDNAGKLMGITGRNRLITTTFRAMFLALSNLLSGFSTGWAPKGAGSSKEIQGAARYPDINSINILFV